MAGIKKCDLLTRTLLAVALVGVGSAGVLAQGSPVPTPADFLFYWTAPTTGVAPSSYDVEVRTTGEDGVNVLSDATATNEYLVSVAGFLVKYEVRVRGVTAAGLPGPWSDWSEVAVRDFEDIDSPH